MYETILNELNRQIDILNRTKALLMGGRKMSKSTRLKMAKAQRARRRKEAK